jgi:hypothetical protein
MLPEPCKVGKAMQEGSDTGLGSNPTFLVRGRRKRAGFYAGLFLYLFTLIGDLGHDSDQYDS